MNTLRNSFRILRNKYSTDQKTYTIITDFENKSERDCVKIDEENVRIYSVLLSKAKRARKSIKNSGLQMNLEVPPPPMPNNRDRFILWKKRNISEKVIPQSEAVYCLTKEGYELNKDYEAYQAINLADQVMKENGIKKSHIDISKDFTDVYTNQDHNILRRTSMYGMHEFNKSRDYAHRNTVMPSNEEEAFLFRNRTLSMPNIYTMKHQEAKPNSKIVSGPSGLSGLSVSSRPSAPSEATMLSASPLRQIETIDKQCETYTSCSSLYPSIDK